MKLTAHFNLEEFDCHDGTKVPTEYRDNVKLLATNLEVIRTAIGEPIAINSGYRSPAFNKKIGGKPKSYHLLAMAADFRSQKFSPPQLAKIVKSLIREGKLLPGGVGLYPTFVHYDVRGKLTVWNG